MLALSKARFDQKFMFDQQVKHDAISRAFIESQGEAKQG